MQQKNFYRDSLVKKNKKMHDTDDNMHDSEAHIN